MAWTKQNNTAAPSTGTGGVAASLFSYYQPKPEPAAGATDPNGRVYKNWTLDQLYGMYDGLVTAYPKYIRKEVAPYKDMSGLYELRRYIFEPEDGYDKTIYVGAGMHGNEFAGKMSLARICQLVCEEWKTSPQLAYLRKRVRMIVNPAANPYGHVNKSMVNANDTANSFPGVGVNCNRNYDSYWIGPTMSSGSDHNGAFPFSENESKWVRDTYLDYGPENIHYGFDFHDAGTASIHGDVWINYNTFHKSSLDVTRPLVWYLGKKYITNREPFIWHDKDTLTSGVFPTWSSRVMGVPASTVEHCYDGGPSAVYDGTFMTRAIDTYLNAILVNTIADHKSPEFKSNKKWFGLEWWKAGIEYPFTPAGNTFANIIPLWNGLVTKYPKYFKKSATFVTSSDGNQVYHYILEPRNYTKTVLVVGGRTEPNREPFNFSIAMLRFAELMCLHANKDEHLTELRDKVRIVFVPYLEHTTKYLNSAGYWSSAGLPTTGQANVDNIISIMNTVGTIDGVIYQRELNKTDILAATTDNSFTLASQDTNDKVYIESYVDYLNTKGTPSAFDRTATAEFANYVFNQRNMSCVRIDTGLDHKMYTRKGNQFDDAVEDITVPVDQYMRFNHEIARRITNLVNVIKLMSK